MKLAKKILIAEDELLIAKVLRMQLEKQGFDVVNVQEESHAVEKAKTEMPDIIIMDVLLKNKTSGLKAAEKIRQAGNNTPIIFTTGNAYEQTLERINSIKNVSVLSKPVEFDQLMAFINVYLERKN